MEKSCCYRGRECNEPLVGQTAYCNSHVLDSRFAEELGHRQCSFKGQKSKSRKRCHRPVKCAKDEEDGAVCAWHLKKERKLEFDQIDSRHNKQRRLEDTYNDIPDSDPDSDECDHVLEKAQILSEQEICDILRVKLDALKKLYENELNIVNLDLCREERNDSKNIQFHFLKQQLNGNELIVANMAKKKQAQFAGVDISLPPTTAAQAKCRNSDCWKQALYALEYCGACAPEQSNQYLYRPKPTKILAEFDLEEQKAKWAKLSTKYEPKTRMGMSHNVRRATISSTMSSPMPHSLSHTPFESEDNADSRPATPNLIKDIQLSEESDSDNSVEVEPASDAEDDEEMMVTGGGAEDEDDKDFIKGDFVPGGAGHVIELGGMRYDMNAENPLAEVVIQLKSTNAPTPTTPSTPSQVVPPQGYTFIQPNQGQLGHQHQMANIMIPVSMAQGMTGMTLQSPTTQQKAKPRFVTTQNKKTIRMATTPHQGGSLLGTNQTYIKTTDGQVLILAQPGTPTTPNATSSKSVIQIAPSKAVTPLTKTPQKIKEATPRNLKMVSIDFFGAQQTPKQKKLNTPSQVGHLSLAASGSGAVSAASQAIKPARNTALERLAKKAEERDNQAKMIERPNEEETDCGGGGVKSSLDELTEALNSPEA